MYIKSKIYNAGIYMRLSKEDEDKKISNSIINQKMFIKNFVRAKKDINIIAEFIDDGYSGVNFERPAFKRLLEEIKKNKIDCVIVKDLSRFSRNYIEAGNYIENIFPFMGVRFIAITDNYDSIDETSTINNVIIPFKNLINDFYCNDISLKIRSSLNAKRKKGDFVSPFAPYGYLKSEENKNKIIVDKYASKIIKSIFKWKLEGMNNCSIANKLNEFGIFTPYEYKIFIGLKYKTNFKINYNSAWQSSMVIRILKNNIYTGILEQGKTTTLNYKSKKIIRKNKLDWEKVENNHEAIISKDKFEIVQKLLSQEMKNTYNYKNVCIFSGKLYCSNCKNNMIRKTEKGINKKYSYYICSLNKKNKKLCTSSHRINAEKLKEGIFYSIKTAVENMFDLSILDFLNYDDNEYINVIFEQIEIKNKEIHKFNNYILLLDKSYLSEIIDKNDYWEIKAIYDKKIINAEKSILSLNREIETIHKDKIKKYKIIRDIERKHVIFFIDRITVYENYRVDIKFNCNIEYIKYLKQAKIV